jgi:hypothetical protein
LGHQVLGGPQHGGLGRDEGVGVESDDGVAVAGENDVQVPSPLRPEAVSGRLASRSYAHQAAQLVALVAGASSCSLTSLLVARTARSGASVRNQWAGIYFRICVRFVVRAKLKV